MHGSVRARENGSRRQRRRPGGAGNLAADGLVIYNWNERNQLSGLSGATQAIFQYDGFRRRRSKNIGGALTSFLYDGVNLVQELAGATPSANLLTSTSVEETLMRTDVSGARTVLVDALGSGLVLADGTGAALTDYTFDPFGGTTVSGAANTNSLQFTGRENDTTGLYLYRARYYHPRLQRFLSEDPIGLTGGINGYSYVGNSPLNAIDPTGLITLPANPGGLGPEWTLDPTHQDPNGSRFRDPNGRPLDWHPGRPGEPGWRGKDHWHDPENFGDRHLKPGTEVPDPAPLPDKTPGSRKDPDPKPPKPADPPQRRSFCQEYPLACIIGPLLPLLLPPLIGLPPIWVPVP